MKIGFTGTQKGMTKEQKEEFSKYILGVDITEFHHGDCIGADEEAHKIVNDAFESVVIITHPPIEDKKRSFVYGVTARKAKPYLERNKDIVNETDMLIACPKSDKEELRSGTWSTIRYAKMMGKRMIIIYPDGSKGV